MKSNASKRGIGQMISHLLIVASLLFVIVLFNGNDQAGSPISDAYGCTPIPTPPPPPTPTPCADETNPYCLIQLCAIVHENAHWDHGDCPPTGLHQLEATLVDKNAAECDAYRAQYACLLREKSGDCFDDPGCNYVITHYMNQVAEQIDKYCATPTPTP